MAKPKSGENKDLKNVKKQLHTIKTGSIKKDKNPKFKNTPVGNVALINNSKAKNKNTPSQKNFQKNKDVKNNAKQLKQNSPNEAQNKPGNKKINLTPTKKLEESDDSNSNEEVIKKDVKPPNSKDIRKGQKQVKEEIKYQLTVERQEDIDKKTIFIDNIPKDTKEAEIKKVFSKFGPINNLRFRNIVPQNLKMSKKVAAITKQIHPKVTTVVVYINYKSKESAQKALSMNGKIFQGNYIHVQIVSDKSMKKEWNNKKAVFIANLRYGTDNNTIWKHFGICGDIESVHLVRDKETGQTKGFGYINFIDENAVLCALELDGTEIMNRPVRVEPYKINSANKKGRKRDCPSNNDDNPRKKSKNNLGETIAYRVKSVTNIKKQKKLQKNNVTSQEEGSILFQGQKANSKNKKKENKLDRKKKKMAQKLAAKSNKSVKV
ncbi:RNA-binding protein 34 [Camponotus floridanus]|uniref:RNA-binding protein 34 n=1 Tax=Camponotus floridanus TaxID=104421 RepID=E1ZVX3_CAMFO|nr:RNA-binding protein 34 [Camponotus floridanus]